MKFIDKLIDLIWGVVFIGILINMVILGLIFGAISVCREIYYAIRNGESITETISDTIMIFVEAIKEQCEFLNEDEDEDE